MQRPVPYNTNVYKNNVLQMTELSPKEEPHLVPSQEYSIAENSPLAPITTTPPILDNTRNSPIITTTSPIAKESAIISPIITNQPINGSINEISEANSTRGSVNESNNYNETQNQNQNNYSSAYTDIEEENQTSLICCGKTVLNLAPQLFFAFFFSTIFLIFSIVYIYVHQTYFSTFLPIIAGITTTWIPFGGTSASLKKQISYQLNRAGVTSNEPTLNQDNNTMCGTVTVVNLTAKILLTFILSFILVTTLIAYAFVHPNYLTTVLTLLFSIVGAWIPSPISTTSSV